VRASPEKRFRAPGSKTTLRGQLEVVFIFYTSIPYVTKQ